MHRLDRRLRLYHGRPPSGPIPPQLAHGPRERAARLVRGALRGGRPAVVGHARWSAVSWWIDDLLADLSVGGRPVDACHVQLEAAARTSDSWIAVPDLLARALDVHGAFPAMAPTTREAFRLRAAMTMRKARSRKRRKVIVCMGADAVGYEVLQDLCDAWQDARAEMTPGTSPLLLITCGIGGQSLDLADAMQVFLSDPSVDEAVQLVAELLGGGQPDRLRGVVDSLGPVPSFLQRVAPVLAERPTMDVRLALGPMLRELAEAVGVAMARPELGERLEVLATGPKPLDASVDLALMRSGLVSQVHGVAGRMARLRSPLVKEIVE